MQMGFFGKKNLNVTTVKLFFFFNENDSLLDNANIIFNFARLVKIFETKSKARKTNKKWFSHAICYTQDSFSHVDTESQEKLSKIWSKSEKLQKNLWVLLSGLIEGAW